MYICDVYNNSLKPLCQRFSNNSAPVFTDEEVITVYLFYGCYQRYFSIKEIHAFAKEYLLAWFPKLPSYQTFNLRLLTITFFGLTKKHIIGSLQIGIAI